MTQLFPIVYPTKFLDLPKYFRSNADNEDFQYQQLNAGVKYQFSRWFNASLGVVVLGDDEDGYYSQPQVSFGYRF
ncbi:MAG: hypothetical protein AAF404_15010 [Pseudomonadota bacterium]